MPQGQQIANPAGVYGLGADSGGADVVPLVSAEASATISKGMAVSIDTAGKILKATTAVEPRLIVGIAYEDIAAGEIGLVQVAGFFNDAKAEGAIAAGGLVQRSATTAGSVAALTSAATTQGAAIGIAVAAAASDLVDLWVWKM